MRPLNVRDLVGYEAFRDLARKRASSVAKLQRKPFPPRDLIDRIARLEALAVASSQPHRPPPVPRPGPSNVVTAPHRDRSLEPVLLGWKDCLQNAATGFLACRPNAGSDTDIESFVAEARSMITSQLSLSRLNLPAIHPVPEAVVTPLVLEPPTENIPPPPYSTQAPVQIRRIATPPEIARPEVVGAGNGHPRRKRRRNRGGGGPVHEDRPGRPERQAEAGPSNLVWDPEGGMRRRRSSSSSVRVGGWRNARRGGHWQVP
jgi:hypothetical protein